MHEFTNVSAVSRRDWSFHAKDVHSCRLASLPFAPSAVIASSQRQIFAPFFLKASLTVEVVSDFPSQTYGIGELTISLGLNRAADAWSMEPRPFPFSSCLRDPAAMLCLHYRLRCSSTKFRE